MNTPYFWLDGLVVQSSANTDKAIFRTLQESLALAKQKLQGFANEPKFTENMAVAFGKGSKFDTLKTRWSNGDFSAFPAIKIRSAKEINGANGAFGANKIYLSLEFLASHQVDIWAITGVILEELGHWVDTQVNTVDSDGDEGAIFAALVQGSLSAQELQLLKAEDDRAVVILDGQSIAIEQQNFTGTAGDDTIVGTSGDDVIDGLEGNDSLSGLEGNDTINSGLGTDTVNGGDGDDLLIVDYSSNTYSVWPGYNISTSITDNGAGSYNGYYASPYGYTTGYVYDVVYFSNIERFNITGTIVDDYITTGNGNDLIDGRGGQQFQIQKVANNTDISN
jgi:Ca2+-binding RTX toxin-like protein